MEIRKEIERIANSTEEEVGHKEENVKLKIIVPLLELLGHKREDLDFEYGTKRKEIDIFIKGLPNDCKIIIDTKKYSEDLDVHVEQIKEYTFQESPLLTVIANGREIRIYSLLRGVAFERSLLYSIKIQDLCKESVWKIVSNLLGRDNIKNKMALKKIEEREREIKDAMANEARLTEEYENRIEGIKSDIETKQEEIEQLRKEKENLEKEMNNRISEIWNTLGLPIDLFTQTSTLKMTPDVEVPLPERYKLRLKFWEQLLARAKEKSVTLHSNRSPTKDNWVSAGAGKGGLSFNYVIWLAEKTAVELYIATGDRKKNKNIFDQLFAKKKKIEADFGDKLNWERLEDSDASRIRVFIKKGGLKEEEINWPSIQDAMIDSMDRLSKAVKPYIQALRD